MNITVQCPKCQGQMIIDDSQERVTCPHCGLALKRRVSTCAPTGIPVAQAAQSGHKSLSEGKKALIILSVIFVIAAIIIALIVPSTPTNMKTGIAKLEKANYEVEKMEISIEDKEMGLVGSIIADCGVQKAICAMWFSSDEMATAYYEIMERSNMLVDLKNEFKKGGYDMEFGIAKNCIYFGSEEAIKDFRK